MYTRTHRVWIGLPQAINAIVLLKTIIPIIIIIIVGGGQIYQSNDCDPASKRCIGQD